jgi:eukaryotic-like serine/threonine-protein kinase
LLLDHGPGLLAVFSNFRFDPLHLELRKAGSRIRLETKPAQILSLLLQHDGKLVTREELRAGLWPNDVHLDFEHAVNKAIHKLRAVLCDDSDAPRFIETISGRGYRFIGSVEFVPRPLSSSLASILPPTNASPKALTVPEEAPSDDVLGAPARKPGYALPLSRLGISIAAAFSAAALVFALVYFYSPLSSGLRSQSVRRSVAVLGFRNLSGDAKDAWLSTAFSEWLSVDLCAGEQLRLVPSTTLSHAGSKIRLDNIGSLSPQEFAEFGKILHADLVISGSYAVTADAGPDQVRLDVLMRDTSTGETLKTASFQGDRTHIFALATQAGSRLRETLNLPATTPQGSGGFRAALPMDPDAARFYANGLQQLLTFNDAKAVDLFTKAEQIEPLHAMTHYGLARALTRLGHCVRAKAEAKMALDLSASLSREQLLIIRGQYHESIQDWNSAAEDYSALFRFFPDVVDYGVRLASAQISASRVPVAFETLASLRRLPPPLRDDPEIDLAEAVAAGASSDFQRQRQSAAAVANKGQQQGSTLLVARAQVSEGEALRSLGQFQAALEIWQSAQGTFAAAGDLSGVSQTLNREAYVLWKMNQGPEAEKRYLDAINTSRSIGDQSSLAAALAGLANITMYEDSAVHTRKYLDEALAIYRDTGNVKEEALTLSLIADLVLQNNHYAEAQQLYSQSLFLSRQANDRSRVAGRFMDLGILDTVQGNLPQAREQLSQALQVYRELGELGRVAYVLDRLSAVHLLSGELETARQDVDQSAALKQQVGDQLTMWQTHMYLAQILLAMDRPVEAEQAARQSLEEHTYSSERFSWWLLSESLLDQGKLTQSQTAFQQIPKQSPGLPFGEFNAHWEILRARLQIAQGSFSATRETLRRAEALTAEQGMRSMNLLVRLAMGNLELQSGRTARGQHLLEAIARDAAHDGFQLVAQKANSALAPDAHPNITNTNTPPFHN